MLAHALDKFIVILEAAANPRTFNVFPPTLPETTDGYMYYNCAAGRTSTGPQCGYNLPDVLWDKDTIVIVHTEGHYHVAWPGDIKAAKAKAANLPGVFEICHIT